MTGLHAILGAIVIVLNAVVVARGLMSKVDEEKFLPFASFSQGLLAVQIVTGFFLVGGVDGPEAPHYFLPLIGLASVFGLRNLHAWPRVRVTSLASFLVVLVSVYAFYSGVTAPK